MEVHIKLLKDAFKKQKKLFEKNEWSQQLLSYAPPVLWFGDMNVPKPKIITIGANPSRSEFLDGNKKSIEKLNYSDLKYLNKAKRRLYHFENEITSLGKDFPYQEIIDSYNQYFHKGSNPYTQWFGRNGKVEGLLNGFDASFYAKDEYKYQALHLDLFPFATLKDFTSILSLAENDLFSDQWSKNLLENLIMNIEPKLIIVFGLTNRNYFEKHFSDSLKFMVDDVYETKSNLKTNYKTGTFKNTKYVGLSTNFGDPKGFSTEDVNSVGQFVKNEIKLD